MTGQYLQVTACGHFTRMPSHRMARARPMDYLLIWVLAGQGHAHRGDREAPARPGDLLLFEPGVAHHYWARRDDPWDILWVHFDGLAAGEHARALQAHGNWPLPLGLDNRLHARFEELIVAHSPGTAAAQHLSDCLLWGVLGLIHQQLAISQGAAPSRPAEPALRRLQDHVHAHLAEPMTLDDLARAAGVSIRQLTRLCRRVLDASPMQYVIQIGRASCRERVYCEV